MKASNYSYQGWEWGEQLLTRVAVIAILFLVVPILLAVAAWAAPSVTETDPILAGPAPGPCARLAAQADYVGGMDANGHRVAPADLASTPVAHLESQTVLADVGAGGHPHRRGGATAAVHLSGLRRAMDAPHGCAPRR